MAFKKGSLLQVIEYNQDDPKMVRLAQEVIDAYEEVIRAEASFREYSLQRHRDWVEANKKENN